MKAAYGAGSWAKRTDRRLHRSRTLLLYTMLETIETNSIRRLCLLVDPSGYSNASCLDASQMLRDMGLATFKGVYALTERGKIALALWRGKQAQHNARERKQANRRWAGNPHGCGATRGGVLATGSLTLDLEGS